MTTQKTLVGLAVVTASLLMVACNSQPDEAKSIESAKSLIQKKDLEAAAIQLKNAIAANPESGQAHFMLGELLAQTGSWALAEPEFRRAAKAGLSANLTAPMLAESLLESGKGKAAIEEFSSVKLTDALATAKLMTTLAIAYGRAGDRERARAAVDAALAARPDHVPAKVLRIRLLATVAPQADVVAAVEALVREFPNDADAALMEGDVALAQRQVDRALASFRKAVSLQPERVNGRVGVIDLLILQGNTDEALKEVAAFVKAFPSSPDSIYYATYASYLRGEYKKAEEGVQKLMLLAPDSLRVLKLAGLIELKLNANAKAEVYFSKAVSAVPADDSARALLAYTYLRMGAPAKALGALGNGVDGPNAGFALLTQAALANLQLGNSAKAEGFFKRAAKLRPDDPELKTSIAMNDMAQGRRDGAMRALQEVAATDTGTVADFALVSELSRTGDEAGALAALDKLSKKVPKSPMPDQLRGQILASQGKASEALQSFQAAVAKDAAFEPARLEMASISLRAGKLDEAAAQYAEISKGNPGSWPALSGALRVMRLQGANDEAVRTRLDAAIAAVPELVEAHLNLIALLKDRHQLKGAIDAAQAALLKVPNDPELLLQLGNLLAMNGDMNQAATTFNKVVALRPNAVEPLLGLANAYVINRNNTAAEAALKKALTVAPDNAAARQALIDLALRARKVDVALQVAKDAQKSYPELSLGYVLEGEIQAQNGHWDAAAAAFRKATELKRPGVGPIRYHFALSAAKQADAAKQFAAKWRASHPNDEAFDFYLGSVAISRSDFAGAERLFSDVTSLNPRNALAWNNLAWVRLQQGKADALDAANKAAALAPMEAAVLDTLAQVQSRAGDNVQALRNAQMALNLVPDSPNYKLQLAKICISSGAKDRAKALLAELAALGSRFKSQDEVAKLQKSI